jgi:hypothetical protein
MSGLFDISTPKKRERFLLIVGGIVLVAVIVPLFYQVFWTDIVKLRTQRNRFKSDIEKLEKDVEQKDAVKKHIDELLATSLPSRDDFAQSLYQNWLMDLATDVGITEKKLDTGSVATVKSQNKTHYKRFTFTLHGKGQLEQVAEFLRRFYNTDYLHLVRKVVPRPVKNSRLMDVSITVEAISLPLARASRTLPAVDKKAAELTDADKAAFEHLKDRNLFAAYVPPRPEGERREVVPPPQPPSFDQSPYCYVIAVVEVDSKPQVWVHLRTEGKIYKLFEGEMFRLGTVRCYVKKIDFDRVQFEAAGGMYSVRVSKSFAEWED